MQSTECLGDAHLYIVSARKLLPYQHPPRGLFQVSSTAVWYIQSRVRFRHPHWPQTLKLVDHSTILMGYFLTAHQGQVRNTSFADHCQWTVVSQILLRYL
jgi:hypothetical protein